MKKIKIFIDSGCDISDTTLNYYNQLIYPHEVNILYTGISIQDTDYESDPSWVKSPESIFFDHINHGGFVDLFQPSLFIWKDSFEKALKNSFDILYLSLSKEYAGGFKQSTIIKNLLGVSFPGSTIEVVDSMNASAGLKLIALKILDDLSNRNLTPENLSEYALNIKNNLISKVKTFWVCESLKYIMYTGRSSDNILGQTPQGSPLMVSKEDGTFGIDSLNTSKEASLESLLLQIPKGSNIEFSYSPDYSTEELFNILYLISSQGCSILHERSFMSPTAVAIAGPGSYSVGFIQN